MDKNLLIILCAFLVFVVASAIILNFMSGNGDRVTIGVKVNSMYSGIASGVKVDLFNVSPEGQPTELIATAYTGDDGIAKFENIPVSGLMYVIAAKEGYVGAKRNISESDKRGGLINVYVREKTYVSLDVYESSSYTDYEDRSMAGVLVKAYFEGEFLGMNYTDSSGTAVIGDVPAYSYITLSLSKEGYENMSRGVYSYRGGHDRVYLTRIKPSTPTRLTRLTVVAWSSGGYLNNSKVELYDQSNGLDILLATKYTSSYGIASFEGINISRGRVEASKSGYINGSIIVTPDRVNATVNLVKLGNFRVRVRVKDDLFGRSVPGAKVALFNDTGDGFTLVGIRYADSDGAVNFGDIIFEQYSGYPRQKIEASKDGYMTETLYTTWDVRDAMIYLPEWGGHNYVLRGNLSVVVRTCADKFSDTRPLKEVAVKLYNRTEDYDYELVNTVYTDSWGRAVFDMGVKAGKIKMSKEGYTTHITDIPYTEFATWATESCLYPAGS